MIAFIDVYRGRFGVEPICNVLREHGCGIAPNTYWVAKKRPPSARALRDAELVVEVRRVYEENLFVYGADKIWAQLNREGIRVARCTVERLMRVEGLSGARRGKAFKVTTRSRRPPRATGRSGRAGLPGTGTEPALGRRSHLRQDPHRMGVRRVHHRRVLADDRRLAGVEVTAIGPRDRRAGDGSVEPSTRRP